MTDPSTIGERMDGRYSWYSLSFISNSPKTPPDASQMVSIVQNWSYCDHSPRIQNQNQEKSQKCDETAVCWRGSNLAREMNNWAYFHIGDLGGKFGIICKK